MICSHLQPFRDQFWLNEEYQSNPGVILQPTHTLCLRRGHRALAKSKWLVSRNIQGEMKTKKKKKAARLTDENSSTKISIMCASQQKVNTAYSCFFSQNKTADLLHSISVLISGRVIQLLL